MKKISIIIPTLQKNFQILKNLINTLDRDSAVDEIILIDNSLKGFEQVSQKLRVIVPTENLYVNPSWNLGVKEAKNDIVGILNDDITIPDNFCQNVIEKLTPDMGIVGCCREFVNTTQNILPNPKTETVTLKKIIGRCDDFGIAIFCYKSSYKQIPEDMKIYYGDDWLIFQNIKSHKQNYCITGQMIYHWGSLSCKEKSFNPILAQDKKLYFKYTRKWYNYIFAKENIADGYRIILLGIKFHWRK